jgi:hypothetical protein
MSLQHRMEALVEDLVGAPPTPLEEGSPPVEGAPSEAEEEETIIIIEGIEIRASAPAPRHRPDLCRGTDASEGQHPRRDPGASKMTKVAAPSVLWRGALALEAEKAAARRQAAAAARAGRRARAIEGRRTASTRDPATTDPLPNHPAGAFRRLGTASRARQTAPPDRTTTRSLGLQDSPALGCRFHSPNPVAALKATPARATVNRKCERVKRW